MPLPDLDPEQRRAALAKAAEVRQIRSQVKQMLKSGEVTVSEVLARARTAEPLGKMRVSELIEALPNIGRVRARRLMEQLDIAPTRRLRGLGPRQVEALLAALERDR